MSAIVLPQATLIALVGLSVFGCTGFDHAYDGPDQPHTRLQCESEWKGHLELAGDEKINTACTRACRSHAREDFAVTALLCQSVFRLTQSRFNFGTYEQCPICSINYPNPMTKRTPS